MERALFYGLLVVASVPLVSFRYFPSEDGPAHVANAALLTMAPGSTGAEYFRVDLSHGTNLLADVVLACLLTFLSAALADKAIALLLLVAVPLSVRWCLRQIDPRAVGLSILAIPLGTGFLLYFGFYNFLLGVVLSFVALGYWLKRMRPAPSGRAAGPVFVGLAILVYVSHPLPFLALLLMLGAALLDETLAARSRGGRATRPFASFPVPVVLGLLIPLGFLVASRVGQGAEIGYTRSFGMRVLAFPVDPVLALTMLEIPFVVMSIFAIAMLGFLALKYCREDLRRSPGFPLAVVTLLLVYFFGPDSVGEGSVILPRTELYLLVLVLFAAASLSLPRWATTVAVVLGSVATIGLAMVRYPAHAEHDAEIREYLSGAPVVKPGSTVLPLWAVDLESGLKPGGRRVRPLIERAGYLTADRGVVDLHHFPGYLTIFPIQFAPGYGILESGRDDRRSFRLGADLVDVQHYERLGHGRIDYVWLWGRVAADTMLRAEPLSRQLFQILEDDYDLVYRSEARGFLEVYARAD